MALAAAATVKNLKVSQQAAIKNAIASTGRVSIAIMDSELVSGSGSGAKVVVTRNQGSNRINLLPKTELAGVGITATAATDKFVATSDALCTLLGLNTGSVASNTDVETSTSFPQIKKDAIGIFWDTTVQSLGVVLDDTIASTVPGAKKSSDGNHLYLNYFNPETAVFDTPASVPAVAGGTVKWYQKPLVKYIGWGALAAGALAGLLALAGVFKKKPKGKKK